MTVAIKPLNLAELLAQNQELEMNQARMAKAQRDEDRQMRLSDALGRYKYGTPEYVQAVGAVDPGAATGVQNAMNIQKRQDQQFSEDQLDKFGQIAAATVESFQRTKDWEAAKRSMLPAFDQMGLSQYKQQFMTATPEAAMQAAQLHGKWKNPQTELDQKRREWEEKAKIEQQYAKDKQPYYTEGYDDQGNALSYNHNTGKYEPALMAGTDKPVKAAKWDTALLRDTEQAKSAGRKEGEAQGSAAAKMAGYEQQGASKQILDIVGTVPGNFDKLIEESTGSGIGARVDAGADMFGITTKGALAVSALKPLTAKLTAIQPRFEGPQSDADRNYYTEMAGDLANPKTPNDQKLRALQAIRGLALKYALQEPPESATSQASTSGPSKYRIGQRARFPDGSVKTFTERGWQ